MLDIRMETHTLLLSEKRKKSDQTILIVDKKGPIGNLLLDLLKNDFQIIIVSEKQPKNAVSDKNILFIRFGKTIPKIPDFLYAYLFIFCHSEKQTEDMLPQFLKKAEKDRSRCIVGIDLASFNKPLWQSVLSLSNQSALVLLGDVFGKKGVFDVSKTVNAYLFQAMTKGRIEIAATGLAPTYPVLSDDMVSGFLTVAFAKEWSTRLFYLFPKHPPSELSLAHAMHRLNPLLKLDFVKKSSMSRKFFIPKGGVYVLPDDYSIYQKLKELSILQKLSFEDESRKRETRGLEKKKKRFGKWFWFLCIFIFLFTLPILSMGIFSFLGISNLKAAKEQMKIGHVKKARYLSKASQNFFTYATISSELVVKEAMFFGKESFVYSVRGAIQQGHETALALSFVLEASEHGQKILSGTSKQPKKDFDLFLSLVKQSIISFQKIQTEQKNAKSSKLPGWVMADKDYVLFSQYAQKIDKTINLLSNSLDVASSILGFEGKRLYLVLFQNNMELRPGGGFIGSYGLLSFDNGKISDFTIHDVYDADGQLKGHVEPPYPIRRYIPQVHWFLRDSNFDIDYQKSASSSAFFLHLETGQRVDGVIGVDVSFVKNLLQAIGPVEVRDYHERVTSENVYLLTQSHVEKDFFEGSTQKKDFLRSLFKAVEQKILSGHIASPFSLLEAFDKSLSQKHVLFAFSKPSIQTIFTTSNASSTLWENRKEGKTMINDFIGINEANLSVNKANYYLRRSIGQQVSIDNAGAISSQLSLLYKNTSVSWPGGDYHVYMRIILPKGAVLDDIFIDGERQQRIAAITDPFVYEKENFVVPQELEIDTYDQDGKTIYGFFLSVPSQREKKVVVSYALAQKAPVEEPSFVYALRLFKQPGAEDDPYSLTLKIPDSFKALDFSEDLVKTKEGLSIATTLATDRDITLQLTKQ